MASNKTVRSEKIINTKAKSYNDLERYFEVRSILDDMSYSENGLTLKFPNTSGTQGEHIFLSNNDLCEITPELLKLCQNETSGLTLPTLIKSSTVHAAWRHWHGEGIRVKGGDGTNTYIAELYSIMEVLKKDRKVGVSAFRYNVTPIGTGASGYEHIRLGAQYIMLTFNQLDKVLPGASEKLKLLDGLGLSLEEAFDLLKNPTGVTLEDCVVLPEDSM